MNTHLKRYAVSLFALLAIVLMHTDVNAASVQLRGGMLHLTSGNNDSSSTAGADVFFYEGQRVELFAGVEQSSLKNASTSDSGNNNGTDMKYSLDITAIDFGLRWKPAMSSRWRPYLALGGIAGKADYKIDSNQKNMVLLTSSGGNTNFIEPRAGLGMDVGLGEQWSLGIEVNWTRAVPAFNAAIADYSTGQIQDVKVNDKGDMIGIVLGLRYAF
jgi:hypothetical protein